MNKLPTAKRAAILRALTEGVSIRGTARMVRVSKTTVLKLLVEVGQFCEAYQDQVLRNLPCERIEADEIWAFVGAKQKNATKASRGDIWTFTAICATTKLAVSWLVGQRDWDVAHAFMRDVASRLETGPTDHGRTSHVPVCRGEGIRLERGGLRNARQKAVR